MQITSFSLSNLHCSSCVSNIDYALYALYPKPASVSSSLVSGLVTVHHDVSLSPTIICDALEDAGFDVRNVLTEDSSQAVPKNLNSDYEGALPLEEEFYGQGQEEWYHRLGYKRTRKYRRIAERHIEVCDLCQYEAQWSINEKGSPPSVYHDQLQTEQPPRPVYDDRRIMNGNTKNIKVDESATGSLDAMDAQDSSPPLIVVEDGGREELWHASLAIGGMTCASCVNAIKEELEGNDWVRKADINLIMNCATIDIVGKDHASDLIQMIEDIGFEAMLDSVTLLQDEERITSPIADSQSQQEAFGAPRRTVDLITGGMYCPNCPERILRSIATFAPQGVHLEKGLSIKDPILRISYTPSAPNFTIRQIISTLESLDTKLSLEIHHPPTLEDRSRALHSRERKEVSLRVFLSVLIAIPTFIIGIVFMSLASPSNGTRQFLESVLWAGVSRAQWALFIMATPVYFFCASLFHVRALKEIRTTWRRRSRTPLLQRFYRFGSMDMLISLGTSIAYFSSVAQLIATGVQSLSMNTATSFYFDSVVFLTMFLLVGRLIEASSKARTGDAVAMLGKLRPTKAILADSASDFGREIQVDLLEYGDIVKVPHGASPPVDGIIVEGRTNFDESSLTGESKLVNKAVGEQVYSGTVNKGSPITIKITGVAGTSMIDRIIDVVREGQTRHAPIERIADTLTAYFVPLITLIAVCTWLIWLALGLSGILPSSYLDTNSGGWAAWSLQFAIAVFVVACPCGLGLAAPTALFVGGGLAAKYGILVKGGGEAFEKASRLDCVVFDKTGTLTIGGEPVVTDCKLLPRVGDLSFLQNEKRLFTMVKRLEDNSSHPIARAIVSYCKIQDQESCEIQEIAEIPGKGMKGVFASAGDKIWSEVIIGNEALMSEHGAEMPVKASTTLDLWKRQGKSIAVVAMKSASLQDSWHIGAILGISDQIRPEATSVIHALRKRGTAVWMLSGDNYDSACAIGAQVGIPSENIIAGVLPSEKADKIQYLQQTLKARNTRGKELVQRRAFIAMVGDGINDSPALTAADVGIAIGSGSDVAISSAEFVLVSSNLNSLITLLDLSKMVFNRIKFNFGWALIYNTIGVPVAAGVLYPLVSNGTHVRLDPVWASLAMALSSVSVVCSSLALRSGIPGIGFRGHNR